MAAAPGLRSLATAGGGGGAAPLSSQPPEARGRGDFYCDTAGAGLCLVMVTCARSAPPPARSDGGARAWAAEAEPERGHGGVSEAACARAAGTAGRERPCGGPGGRGSGRRGRGGLGVPAAPRRARRARPGPVLLLDGATGGVARGPRQPGGRPRWHPPREARGPRGGGGLAVRPGGGRGEAAAGSLPPSSGPWGRLRRGMRSAPLTASWGEVPRAQGAPLTDRWPKTKRQAWASTGGRRPAAGCRRARWQAQGRAAGQPHAH